MLSQQDVFYEGSGEPEIIASPSPLPPRKYPPRPVVGVGAVVVHEERVVLIKRKYEPLAGQWSLPGGTLELGESLEAGVAREIHEETGLDVEVGPVVEVFDRILLDAQGRVQYHFVLVDYLCRPVGGQLQAGSDVDDAVWVVSVDVANYHITAKATRHRTRAVDDARARSLDDAIYSSVPVVARFRRSSCSMRSSYSPILASNISLSSSDRDVSQLWYVRSSFTLKRSICA